VLFAKCFPVTIFGLLALILFISLFKIATIHQIQKELFQILSSRVRKHIGEEIGDSKFCIVVD